MLKNVRWPYWAALGLAVFAFIGVTLDWNNAEWASWVQAIGSIVALGIAIWLPAKARIDARIDARTDALEMAKTYTTQLAVATHDIIAACEDQLWDGYDVGRHVFADACLLGQSVPIGSLHGEALAGFMVLRAHAVGIHVRSGDHTAGGNWQHWLKEFKTFANNCQTALDVLDGKTKIQAAVLP